MSAPVRTRHAVVMMAVGAAVVALMSGVARADGNGGGGHRLLFGVTWSTAQSWQLVEGWPGLPPPITPLILQKFAALLASYQSLGEDSSLSFAQWILMNGVEDPREQICLIWLYWQYVNRVAVA